MPSANYPQLPRGVWLGVWAILRKTPSRKLDDRALAAELGVQPTAAKAYAKELMKVGILDDECRPTSLANRWRQDGRDTTIIQEILEGAYPQELRDLAPIGDTDREKVIRWFMNDGLGEGLAKNRAATYIMLSEGVDEEASSSTKLPSKPRKLSTLAMICLKEATITLRLVSPSKHLICLSKPRWVRMIFLAQN